MPKGSGQPATRPSLPGLRLILGSYAEHGRLKGATFGPDVDCIGDIPCVELAEILGLPEGTVRSRLFRARKLVLAAVDGLRKGLQIGS